MDEARVFHLIPERRPLLQSFRTKQRACEVSGHIYVVGGLNRHGKTYKCTAITLKLQNRFAGDSLSTVEYYDPSVNAWNMASPMSMLRSRLGVAVLRGKLYAFGGYNGSDRLASVEVYDAVRKEWSMVSPMQCKRRCVCEITYGITIHKLFVFDCTVMTFFFASVLTIQINFFTC